MVFGTIGMASLMMLWPAMDIDKYEGIGGFIKSKWMVFGTIWGVVIMTMAFQFGPLRELLGLSAVAWGNWCWFIGAGLGSATLVQLIKLKSPRTFLW
jgi:hypothetical protein